MPRLLLDLTPLRESPAFRRLWIGSTMSMLGNQFTVVAISLEVFELTRSTFAVGMVGVAALLPLIVSGLYGGSMGDAHNRRTVGLWTTFGLFAVTVALAVHSWAPNCRVSPNIARPRCSRALSWPKPQWICSTSEPCVFPRGRCAKGSFCADWTG